MKLSARRNRRSRRHRRSRTRRSIGDAASVVLHALTIRVGLIAKILKIGKRVGSISYNNILNYIKLADIGYLTNLVNSKNILNQVSEYVRVGRIN